MHHHVRVVDSLWGGTVRWDDFDVEGGVGQVKFEEGVEDYV